MQIKSKYIIYVDKPEAFVYLVCSRCLIN